MSVIQDRLLLNVMEVPYIGAGIVVIRDIRLEAAEVLMVMVDVSFHHQGIVKTSLKGSRVYALFCEVARTSGFGSKTVLYDADYTYLMSKLDNKNYTSLDSS